MTKIIPILIFSLVFSDYAGGYAGGTQRLGSSAREIALSNSIVALNNVGFNSFSNPGFIGHTKEFEFGSSIFSLSADRNIQAISVSRPLPPKGGAALSFFRTGVTDLIAINSDEITLGEMGYSDGYIMLSFGINISRYFSAGFNVKSLFQKYSISSIEEHSAKAISLDLGFVSSPLKNINIGMKIENIIGGFNWTVNISDESMPYKEIIPIRLTLGASYTLNKNLLLLYQNESIYISEDIISHRFSTGLEYYIDTTIPIIIRCGLRQKKWVKDNQSESIIDRISPSAGFGIEYKLMNKFLLNLDYAFQFNEIGMNNFFSISTQIK